MRETDRSPPIAKVRTGEWRAGSYLRSLGSKSQHDRANRLARREAGIALLDLIDADGHVDDRVQRAIRGQLHQFFERGRCVLRRFGVKGITCDLQLVDDDAEHVE